jgi:hypothetical protein
MGNIARRVKAHPFVLERPPRTLRELIEESVRACIRVYRERGDQANAPKPLTDEQYEGMREVGKFAFGVHYNENEIHEEKAIAAAVEAVADGLVRIFKGNEELCELDEAIDIAEGDVFTFVKLTMLAGSFF